MKKLLFIAFVFVQINNSSAQNLIKNPSFEDYYISSNPWATQLIFNDTFAPINGSNAIKNWMNLSGSMDAYWTHHFGDIPSNFHCTQIYPHTDSSMVGGFEYFHGFGGGGSCREFMEGQLTIPLITNHKYVFGIWVQLFDTIYPNEGDIGKIYGINSLGAYFSNTIIPYVDYTACNLPIQNYTPQVQINQMVTDTQIWVLLQDTFIAAGGEQYVSIGNFKTDAQLQTQLVDSIRNLPAAAYYFFDDVSLIDITPNGVEEVGVGKLEVYPNPASQSLVISSKSLVNTIEVTNVLGQVCIIPPLQRGQGGLLILNIASLPSGIYFLKATDTNGNTINGKFVKE